MLQIDVPVMLLDHDLNGMVSLPSVDLITFTGYACTYPESDVPSCSSFAKRNWKSSLVEPRKLHFYMDSILLMQLKVTLINGTRATEMGFFRARVILFGQLKAH